LGSKAQEVKWKLKARAEDKYVGREKFVGGEKRRGGKLRECSRKEQD